MNTWQVMWEAGLKKWCYGAYIFLTGLFALNTIAVFALFGMWIDETINYPWWMKANTLITAAIWIIVGLVRISLWIRRCHRTAKIIEKNRLTHAIGQECTNEECIVCHPPAGPGRMMY